MVHIILLRKQNPDTPHLLVTIKAVPSGEEKVIRCTDLMYNVKQFALLDENDEPIFYSSRRLYEVVKVQPVE